MLREVIRFDLISNIYRQLTSLTAVQQNNARLDRNQRNDRIT